MNINEQLHKIQMEKDNKREKVMLHIKLIYKSEAHSYTNTFFYKNQVYHTQILMGPQQTAKKKIPTILTGMQKEFDNFQQVKNLLPSCAAHQQVHTFLRKPQEAIKLFTTPDRSLG